VAVAVAVVVAVVGIVACVASAYLTPVVQAVAASVVNPLSLWNVRSFCGWWGPPPPPPTCVRRNEVWFLLPSSSGLHCSYFLLLILIHLPCHQLFAARGHSFLDKNSLFSLGVSSKTANGVSGGVAEMWVRADNMALKKFCDLSPQ
jgi:hypothetical protein